MSIGQVFLYEFTQEMAGTRKTLERVPEGKFSWKPHDKSGAMGWLAGHVADLPHWGTITMSTDALDIDPPGGPAYTPFIPRSSQELMEYFDRSVAEAQKAITAADDAAWTKPWSLLKNEQTIFTVPRIVCMRSFVMNHLIHHRAQLGVYLRMNDIPVPALYGPSADENGL